MLGPSHCTNVSYALIYLQELYTHKFLCLENYTGVCKENNKSEKTATSKFWESVYLFSPGFRDEYPTSGKSNSEEFADLRKKRDELIDEIHDSDVTLKDIKLALKLDAKLPEPSKEKKGILSRT